MALMKFRERNHVLWRGARPGHDGTQITKENSVTGAAVAPVYTVPANYVLFITYLFLSSRENAAAAASAYLRTQPIGEAGVIRLMDHRYDVAGHQISVSNLTFPIEVAENIVVEVGSSNANVDAWATIHGWIEPE